MTDEQDKQPVSDQPSDAEAPETVDAEQPAGEQPAGEQPPAGQPEAGEESERSFKESARGAVAKVVGVAVELGSILGGEGGNIVEAQRDVAEADAEEFIDRIDGED